MRTIKAEPLTRETFAPFGTFYSMTEPQGYSLNGEIHRFFPDRIAETYTTRVGFSPILVKKPEEMKVTQVEYHTTTPEMILPLNDDMILHVAPNIYNPNWIFSHSSKETGRIEGYAGGISHIYTGNDSSPE